MFFTSREYDAPGIFFAIRIVMGAGSVPAFMDILGEIEW